MLSVEDQAQILSLYFSQKKKVRCIAREIGINRKTVKAVIERRTVHLNIKRHQRSSILDPYKSIIENYLKDDPKIPANTILKRIREEGYSGGYTILKDWIYRQKPLYGKSKKEAFLDLNFVSGECTQVDWGEFGDVFGDGVKIHCFVMVLCYSRLLYIEFTRSEKFEDFIRCHENALRYFGGVTQEYWYDNLATAVSERHGKLIRFNARFFAYMGHYGAMVYACNQGQGNEKGRVEDGVKFIRSSFWPGRKFKDFADLCQQAKTWYIETANRREHRATRRIPELVFEVEEKKALLPLNPEPYDTDEIFSKVVPPQFYITYETNRYSVPWTLVGQAVTGRVDADSIRFFYNNKQVASHVRSYEKYQKFKKPGHEEGLLEIKPKGKTTISWQIKTVKSIGPALERYLGFLKAGPRSLRFEISKLLALYTIYGADELNSVVENFLHQGTIGADKIELALKNKSDNSVKPAPLKFQNEILTRIPPRVDLRRYDELLFNSISNTSDNSKFENEEKPNGENPKDNNKNE